MLVAGNISENHTFVSRKNSEEGAHGGDALPLASHFCIHRRALRLEKPSTCWFLPLEPHTLEALTLEKRDRHFAKKWIRHQPC